MGKVKEFFCFSSMSEFRAFSLITDKFLITSGFFFPSFFCRILLIFKQVQTFLSTVVVYGSWVNEVSCDKWHPWCF
jgi:hypothetical protein